MADAEHFALIVPPLAPAVIQVAAALVGMADAEDAAQEAMLRAWQAWGTLRSEEAARSWLLHITVNVCHRWRERRIIPDRRHTQPLPEGKLPLPAALSEFTLGTGAHTAELDLRDALQSLPDDLKLVVTLRYFGGMDASEIGEALGVPAATVRTRLRRALTLLREQLRPSDELPATRHAEGTPHA